MTWNINNSTPSTSSQEQEAAFSLTSYLATIRSELVKLNNTQEMSSSPDSETVSYQPSLSGTTSAPSTESRGEEQLTFLLEDSHAKTSALLEPTITLTEKSEDLMARNQVSGDTWLESLWRWPLDLRLSKTRPISELRDLLPSSKTLTQWGITQGGLSLGADISAPITTESGCGFLPTPTCHNAKEGAYPAEFTRNTPTLAAQIGGKVNPNWNESRMGWPIGWTDLEPLETDKIVEWRHRHSTFFLKD